MKSKNDIFEKHHNLLSHEEIADILLNKCAENSALAQYENLIVNSPSVYNYFMNRGVDLTDYIDFKPGMSIHPNFFKKTDFDNFTDDELEEMQFKVFKIMIKYKMCYDYISNIVYLSDRIIDIIEKEIPKMFHKPIFSSFE